MSNQESISESSGSQPSSGNSNKLKMIVAIAHSESFNDLETKHVGNQLADYEELWQKAILVDDTLYLQPTTGSEKMAMLLAKSLGADEVDLMQVDEWIEHLNEQMRQYKTADYKKDIKAIESFGKGPFIRVWWD